MAETVTWDGLRELAAFQAEKGCAISLYVDLDPSIAPTAGDADARVSSLLNEGERRAEASSRWVPGRSRTAPTCIRRGLRPAGPAHGRRGSAVK